MKAMILVTALCALALPPLSAQQAAVPAPAVVTSTAPVSASSTALPGPRLQPEWRRFDPSATDSTSARAANMSGGGSHTIVVSTLALILIVVIVVLLATN